MLKGIDKAHFDFAASAGMAIGLGGSYFIPKEDGHLWIIAGTVLVFAFGIFFLRVWRLKSQEMSDPKQGG